VKYNVGSERKAAYHAAAETGLAKACLRKRESGESAIMSARKANERPSKKNEMANEKYGVMTKLKKIGGNIENEMAKCYGAAIWPAGVMKSMANQ
jgi:hypothetical protein